MFIKSFKLTLCLVCLLFFFPILSLNAQSPTQNEYKSAVEAYENGNYKEAIEKLKKLLDELKLTSIDKIIETHSILGASYLNEKDEESAKSHFKTLLNFDAEHTLSPDYYPPRVIEFFNEIKSEKNNTKVLKDNEKGLRNDNSEQTFEIDSAYGKTPYTKRPDYRNPYYNNFIPFGYGQFSNNETSKGYVFMITETVTFVSLISTAVAYKIIQKSDGTFDNPSLGSGLKAGLYSSLSIFSFAAIFGIADSLFNYKEYPNKKEDSEKISFSLIPSNKGYGLALLLTLEQL